MNCLEFRRLKLAQPNDLPQEAQAHALQCPSCTEFAQAQDAFEQRLGEALRVPVDAALGARVLLRQRLATGSAFGDRRRLFVRAALVLLGCALAIGVGMRVLAPDPALFDALANHVAREPRAFTANEARTQAELEAALALSGAKVVRALDADISYIHDCPVPGGLGKHIILRTGEGTITVLTMPNKQAFLRRTKLANGYAVAIIPCKHGSIALVARSEAELAALEARLSQHVQWSA